MIDRSAKSNILALAGATLIDGTGHAPVPDAVVVIESDRILAAGSRSVCAIPVDAPVIDLQGKYLIPGLMNANVHLLGDLRMEHLIRYRDQYEELITEAAQVALKNGLTTVFDTLGPRKSLMGVRNKINSGEVPGSRIFCAGNIIGFDGPLSTDFNGKTADVASGDLIKRTNAIWVENTGPELTWMTPDQVAQEIRTYIGKGIDFIKYASNDHNGSSLAFTERVQAVLVDEAHRAGITAQAHTMSVEGLRVAIEAGCDLIQHVNITGPVPIPETTLELLAEKQTGAVVFSFTQRRLEVIRKMDEWTRRAFAHVDTNCRNLIRSGAPLLLANDGSLHGSGLATDPRLKNSWLAPGEDNLIDLDHGHFYWFKAMEEQGMAPLEMLRAATRNIAVAYGKDKDLGTLEAGKVADIVILDKDPLQSSENYRSIHMIFKDGAIVDRQALPLNPILTGTTEPFPEETSSYGRYT